jgi:transposase-like protein
MLGELAAVDTAEQVTPACPSCGDENTIYLGAFPQLREDAWGCRLCGREFNLIPDEGDQQ